MFIPLLYRDAGKSLARSGRKQARKHVRDARDFNNIKTRAVIKLLFLQGKAPKEIHAIMTETFACFLPGRAKDSSAPLYFKNHCSLSLRPVRIIVKSAYWLHVRPSVRQSASPDVISAAPVGRISLKFDNGDNYKNLSRNSKSA